MSGKSVGEKARSGATSMARNNAKRIDISDDQNEPFVRDQAYIQQQQRYLRTFGVSSGRH